jgi:hypothetical protein
MDVWGVLVLSDVMVSHQLTHGVSTDHVRTPWVLRLDRTHASQSSLLL